MHRSTPIWVVLFAVIGTYSLWFEPNVGSQAAQPAATGGALRFFGSGAPDRDRVKIALADADASQPVNVGQDLTVEFWMKARVGDNAAEGCDEGRGWYYGSVIVDRDIFGEADAYGDYGIALMGGRIIVGVNTAAGETQLCSSAGIADNQWQHIAFTRNASSGVMRLFIDGALVGEANGPTGRLDYQIGRATEYPNSDPFLVLGAEKHDFPGSLYYNGLLDDLRISNTARYSAAFTRPNAPHPADTQTVALYRFDTGAGTQIADTADAAGGPSSGLLIPRNSDPAEHWSSDTPFSAAPPTQSPTTSPTMEPTVSATPSPTVSPTVSPTSNPTPKPTCNGAPTGTASRPSSTPTATTTAAPATPAVTMYRIFLPLIRC